MDVSYERGTHVVLNPRHGNLVDPGRVMRSQVLEGSGSRVEGLGPRVGGSGLGAKGVWLRVEG